MLTAFIAGFLLGGSLILAIGAQNAFVLRQEVVSIGAGDAVYAMSQCRNDVDHPGLVQSVIIWKFFEQADASECSRTVKFKGVA